MTPLNYNLEGRPEIFIVSNAEEGGRQVGMRRVGLGWHTDGEGKHIPQRRLIPLRAAASG